MVLLITIMAIDIIDIMVCTIIHTIAMAAPIIIAIQDIGIRHVTDIDLSQDISIIGAIEIIIIGLLGIITDMEVEDSIHII